MQAGPKTSSGLPGEPDTAGTNSRLCWKPMRLMDVRVPAGHLERGDYRRLVMPRRYQLEWIRQMTGRDTCVWLESGEDRTGGGSEVFSRRVSCLMQQRGALANLSLRENIMLPVLYDGGQEEIERCMNEVPAIALRLEITGKLDEQAGERSGYMHGLIALGRAMLMRPEFVVVQDVHAGMPPHRQSSFCELFSEVIGDLHAGVLYLSASGQDGSGLAFSQSLEFTGIEEAT